MEESEASTGIGMEAFMDDWERFIGRLLGQNGQQHISDERQIGQQVRIAAARAILAHNHVTAPMITDFDATPVSANQV